MSTAVEDGVSERHAPTVLIESGHGHFGVLHLTDGVAGNKRCSMTIGPQSKVDEVDDGSEPDMFGEQAAE